MGDLIITFICPNGQSMIVHQQGGGGTYLGQPVDDENLPNDPGVGNDYYWEPNATNGTWVDNTQPAGVTLPAGSYESVQPFSNLNGCPLNGTWEIEVCDLFGFDNGFIFDWSIEFNPDLYPELISFTPIFSQDCDSTYWYTENNEFILEESQNDGDCSTVDINPTIPDTIPFYFHTTNNWGCHYEDTLNVEVQGVNLLLTATPRQFCGQDLPIIASTAVGYGVSLEDCDFEWSSQYAGADVSMFPNFPISDTAGIVTTMEIPTTFTLDVSFNIPGSSETCKNSHSIDIETCEITIPNIFTPNDDNVNDDWYVVGLESFVGSEVYVYDRWGVEVYYNKIGNDGVNESWNGEIDNPLYKNSTVSAGVYYYVVKINVSDSEELIVVDQSQNENMINQDVWTTYTGVLTINK